MLAPRRSPDFGSTGLRLLSHGVQDSRAGERLPDIPMAINALVTHPFVAPLRGREPPRLRKGARFTPIPSAGWKGALSSLPNPGRQRMTTARCLAQPAPTTAWGQGLRRTPGAHCPLWDPGIKGKKRQLPAAAPGGGETSPGPARATLSG